MARIDYDEVAAGAFRATRQLSEDGLVHWRRAIARHLAPWPGMRVVDVGAGTGVWAAAMASWYDISVMAVEPSPSMRARSAVPNMLAGIAGALPIADSSADGAWLSTVVHHIPDLPGAARDLARVLRPGAPVLIRSAFPGRYERITIVRYWPESARVLDTYPTVTDVRDVFSAAGFSFIALEPVPQVSAATTAAMARRFRREAHTPLMLIPDSAYQAGLARLHAAAATESSPVVDTLDLLVLRRGSSQ